MKNKIIISLAFLICISVQSNAQYYSKSSSMKDIKKQELQINETATVESKAYNKSLTKLNYEMYKNYLNVGIMNMTLKQDNAKDLKSNFGLYANVGRTFFLHKKPIENILRIGIDATWLDLNYTNYKIKHITYDGTNNYKYHQGEISMHIGPSVSITPAEKWNIHGYFRYAPSFSMMYADDTLYGNYATFFVGGVSISYSTIGLGIETRFGNCKYNEITSKDEDETSIDKVKYNAWKAYLTFRF